MVLDILTLWLPALLFLWSLILGPLSTEGPGKRLDFYFNLIQPWWLQVNAIRTYLKPLDVF